MAAFTDYERIERLLRRYFAAVGDADVETLKTIFHPQASMFGYLGADAVLGTPEIFYADLSSKPSMHSQGIDCRMVIREIRVCGNVAQASLFVDNFFGAFQIEDFFHLLKVDGEWRILCKTFTTL